MLEDKQLEIQKEIRTVKHEITYIEDLGEYSFSLMDGVNKKQILSRYKPKASIVPKVKLEGYNKQTFWIILGLGFGYMAESILEQCGEEANILIIEPDKSFCEKQLELVKNKQIRVCRNVTIFTGEDFDVLERILEGKLTIENLHNTSIIEYPHYTLFYPHYLEKVLRKVVTLQKSFKIENNTVKIINSKGITNLMKNMYHTNKMYDFSKYKDAYKGIPAVIVSAGPSLDKNIQWITDFEGIVFGVGRALPAIKQTGRQVDFTAVIDYSDKIVDTFQMDRIDIPLIALASANHKVIERVDAPLYMVGEEDITKAMYDMRFEHLPLSGSVATLCCSAAQYMGCSPIIFIGQDLAYTDMKQYAAPCDAFRSNESIKDAILSYPQVKGYNGDKVYTDNAFMVFLKWFEDFIREHSETVYINATEGGAMIEGAVQMTFQEVVSKYRARNIEKVDTVFCYKGKEASEALEITLVKIEQGVQLITKAQKVAKKLYLEYNRAEKASLVKTRKYLKELNRLDEKIEALKVQAVVCMIYESKVTDILQDKAYQEAIDTDMHNAVRIAKGTYEAYDKLLESYEEVSSIIQEILKEVEVK